MNNKIYIIFLFITLVTTGCIKEREQPAEEFVCETSVNLIAIDSVIRLREAILGNLVADVYADFAVQQGHKIDFAIENGGSVRHDETVRIDGIYPKGSLTTYDFEEILPFYNYGVVVDVTGEELKAVFERSIATYESEGGTFLHVSKGMQVLYDLSQSAQTVDQTVFPEQIAATGNRVVAMILDGDTISSQDNFIIFVPDYIADGGDKYITFRDIPDYKKTIVETFLLDAFIEYASNNSPLNPVLEGRIVVNK